ncbi:MAG: hypothetical protein QG588_2190 [Candidatus Poribacteria bacterium]|nr:hypothetical protein [Candidatus Poribacteria bacterium]
MPGPPVTIGCAVMLTPGAAGPPDSGFIVMIPPGGPTFSGMPLAVTGSLCAMVNSVIGVPYVVPIGPVNTSMVKCIGPQPQLVRMGDMIPTPPGVLTILGPPGAPIVMDITG